MACMVRSPAAATILASLSKARPRPWLTVGITLSGLARQPGQRTVTPRSVFPIGKRKRILHRATLVVAEPHLMLGGDPGSKTYRRGTHRARTPDDTIARVT